MAPMPALTIFNEAHKSLGAKMIDFGGWEMPIHYGSQLSEHLHTRASASLFDVSHMAVVDCLGTDSSSFLTSILANNIQKLKVPGMGLYSCMLNHGGGIIDDLIVYRLEDRYRLVINASTAESDLIWMNEKAAAFKDITLTPRRYGLNHCADPEVLLAVQGPLSLKVLAQAFPTIVNELDKLAYFHATYLSTNFGKLMFARTGYTGEDGFEISIPLSQGQSVWDYLLSISSDLKPAGLGARDTLRIEAGYNLYGQDMNAQTSPLDCGLSWTVDLKSERDFIGKSHLIEQGQQFDFLGLVLLGKGIIRAHQKVVTPSGIGEICSGTYSPTLEKSIGLARLPKNQTLGSIVQVNIRDQKIDAQLVKPQFVRRGQILI
jgi:aminomethyltransferase